MSSRGQYSDLPRSSFRLSVWLTIDWVDFFAEYLHECAHGIGTVDTHRRRSTWCKDSHPPAANDYRNWRGPGIQNQASHDDCWHAYSHHCIHARRRWMQQGTLHFADSIPALSPAISPPPKESFSIPNPQPTFDCTLAAAAAALTAMIDSPATRTPIVPMIMRTANLKEVMYSLSATELSHGSRESKISSLCHLSKPNTSPTPRAPVKRNGCSSSTEIYTAKMHRRSRSIATIKAHLVTSQLES